MVFCMIGFLIYKAYEKADEKKKQKRKEQARKQALLEAGQVTVPSGEKKDAKIESPAYLEVEEHRAVEQMGAPPAYHQVVRQV